MCALPCISHNNNHTHDGSAGRAVLSQDVLVGDSGRQCSDNTVVTHGGRNEAPTRGEHMCSHNLPDNMFLHDGSGGCEVLVKKTLVKNTESVKKGNKVFNSSCDAVAYSQLKPVYTHQIKGSDKATGVTFGAPLPRGYVSSVKTLPQNCSVVDY